MSDERRKAGVAFWATVVVVVAVLYVLSLGPAAWLHSRHDLPVWTLYPTRVFYTPIFWICEYAPLPAVDAINWYISIWHQAPEMSPPPVPNI
jgi:hypothetical protein